ncbi:unnamed protein product [Acanthoscelides obtectus]|uniref:Uncharacterized protein n=1 Tax=Acanthoscelides obtectus TaxID=200917 RepID=A0A9P0NWY3_ACAOB|nr:unnamed protein product [Acanthoscelides obtectus]CAK1633899.1 hypothetical protein AOBTE_LOCUS8468 [Acanthoscelides obtectus]
MCWCESAAAVEGPPSECCSSFVTSNRYQIRSKSSGVISDIVMVVSSGNIVHPLISVFTFHQN